MECGHFRVLAGTIVCNVHVVSHDVIGVIASYLDHSVRDLVDEAPAITVAGASEGGWFAVTMEYQVIRVVEGVNDEPAGIRSIKFDRRQWYGSCLGARGQGQGDDHDGGDERGDDELNHWTSSIITVRFVACMNRNGRGHAAPFGQHDYRGSNQSHL